MIFRRTPSAAQRDFRFVTDARDSPCLSYLDSSDRRQISLMVGLECIMRLGCSRVTPADDRRPSTG
jgi:hypothetical protein